MLVQNDHNIVVEMDIKDDNGVVNLTGANVSLKIKTPEGKIIIKDCNITSAADGIVQVNLTEEDLKESGNYHLEAIVNTLDGRFNSNINLVYVGQSL